MSRIRWSESPGREWRERKGDGDLTSDERHEDGSPEGTAETRDTRQQRETEAKPGPGVPTKPQKAPKEPYAPVPRYGGGWARAPTSQVVRTVAIALLTAVVVVGALFLIWQVRTFIAWLVIALFLAAVLNPAVNWLQRRHHLIKRPLAIALTYLGVVVALLFVVGIFLPLLIDQVNGLINFVAAAAQAPEGPTEYIKSLAQQNGLGGLFARFSDQLKTLRDELGGLVRNLFSSTGAIAIGAAGFIAALATVLTLTFFLLLGSERYVNAGVGLFPEAHQPLVRRLLTQSAGAISGYITGNLAISVICGVTTFVVLLILGMPYAAPLALVVVGLFVEPWKAVVLLVYIVVYQQVEGSVLQPLVYSKAVQLNGLVILIALLVGGQLLGIPGALLAIPVAEIIRIVVTELLAYRRTSREANKPAVPSPQPTKSN